MRNALRLAAKDVRVELRGREAVTAMVLIALLVVTVGLLAHLDLPDAGAVSAGVLWTALAFAGAVGFTRAFAAEHDRGTHDALLALPVERGTLYAGKVLANFLFILAVAAVTLPALVLLGGATFAAGTLPPLALLVALGALGVAGVGVTLSALAAETRARELLLPVLLLPLLLPVVMAGVSGTLALVAGAPVSAARGQLLLLLGYDMAFLAASWLVFDSVVEG